jgi:putative zinc finger/helix-turn-helix YgiT family protein
MKCIECGSEMTTKKENVPFAALPGTVLVGVDVSRCRTCGAYEVAIPAIEKLMHILAAVVIRKPARLVGAEVRFLRKYLGYSSGDFAKRIGSAPSTVSKWENDAQPIGLHSDLLLRAMVALDKKIDSYTSDAFIEISDEMEKPRYAMRPAAKTWRQTELRAS